MTIKAIAKSRAEHTMTSQTNRKQKKTDEKYASFFARQEHMRDLEKTRTGKAVNTEKAVLGGKASTANNILKAYQLYKEIKPDEDYHAFIQSHIDVLYEKIKNGDTEVRYQIGAQEFSEDEWDKLLERFDKTEEELREQMHQEHEKRQKEAEKEALEQKMQLSKEDNIYIL